MWCFFTFLHDIFGNFQRAILCCHISVPLPLLLLLLCVAICPTNNFSSSGSFCPLPNIFRRFVNGIFFLFFFSFRSHCFVFVLFWILDLFVYLPSVCMCVCINGKTQTEWARQCCRTLVSLSRYMYYIANGSNGNLYEMSITPLITIDLVFFRVKCESGYRIKDEN